MEKRHCLGQPLFQPAPTHQDYGVTRALFDEWRSPRFGTTNPTNLTNPFWVWQVKTKIRSFWVTREILGEKEHEDGWDARPCLVTWCMDRRNMTLTCLPDGRLVFIGGWNQDPCCPVDAVYNDIVVIDPSGEVAIYGYPEDCFPLMCDHTATLVGHEIVIIGSQDSPEKRSLKADVVYALNLDDYSMRCIETRGDIPPTIAVHWAELEPDGKSIRITDGNFYRGPGLSEIENVDDWSFDPATGLWRRLTHRNWPRWEFKRKDRKRNHLRDLRALFDQKQTWEKRQKTDPISAWKSSLKEKYESSLQELTEKMERDVDWNLFTSLYFPVSLPHTQIKESDGDLELRRFEIDGVLVRFRENSSVGSQMTIEGELPAATIQVLVEEILAKLNALEKAEWIAEEIKDPATASNPDSGQNPASPPPSGG